MPIIESNRLLPDNYRIEISSPGIDRILVRKKDFIQNIGNEIKVELIEKIENKKITGVKFLDFRRIIFYLPTQNQLT